MLRHRIFVAKAERIDSKQLELEFATKLAALDELARQLPMPPAAADAPPLGASPGANGSGGGGAAAKKPTGRRDLRGLKLPEVRIEITDPVYETLVAEGKAARVDFEESCKLGWQRGGRRKVIIARAKYKTLDDDPVFETAAVPPELLPRALAAPSMLAHIVHEKFGRGLPLYRIETGFRRDGVPIDRGTMSRWLEELGGAVSATIVEAARREAMASAFCISTDACSRSGYWVFINRARSPWSARRDRSRPVSGRSGPGGATDPGGVVGGPGNPVRRAQTESEPVSTPSNRAVDR